MSSDEPHGQPEGSGPQTSSAPASGRDRPRYRPRRPRHRRGGRGGGQGGSAPRTEASAPTGGQRSESAPEGGIQQAISHARHIQTELEGVLEELNEILRILDQAEKEKHASDEEIDTLRETLERLRRGRGRDLAPAPQRISPTEERRESRATQESEPEDDSNADE